MDNFFVPLTGYFSINITGTFSINTCINECKAAGLPEPLIENASGGICMILFKNVITEEYLIDKG